jgi:hypothetical protein
VKHLIIGVLVALPSLGAAQLPLTHTNDFFVACTSVAALRRSIELSNEVDLDTWQAWVDGNHGCLSLQGGLPATIEKSFHVDGIAFNVIKFRHAGMSSTDPSLYAMAGAVSR